eukprot:TRINITY_DN9257_c0_g1_i1.p1 TRINITY_DN9257_c0_g1~~TRINITY_DN9257_c0_g1_i1.p1  ORF type:complete len:427 (-),score=134.31 TRINITY_DN9257_c0_g1_i1:12-1292(-)
MTSRAESLYKTMKSEWEIMPDCNEEIWMWILECFGNNKELLLKIFEEWKAEGKALLNPGMNLLLIGIGKTGDLQTLEKIAKEAPTYAQHESYWFECAKMFAKAKGGGIDEALNIYDANQNRIEFVASAQQFIPFLMQEGHFDRGVLLLERLLARFQEGDGLIRNVALRVQFFNVILKEFGKRKNYRAQGNLLLAMKNFEVAPNAITYQIIMESCDPKDLTIKKFLYDLMLAKKVEYPLGAHLEMLKVHAARAESEPIFKILEALSEFDVGNLELSNIIENLQQISRTSGLPEDVLRRLQAMQKNLQFAQQQLKERRFINAFSRQHQPFQSRAAAATSPSVSVVQNSTPQQTKAETSAVKAQLRGILDESQTATSHEVQRDRRTEFSPVVKQEVVLEGPDKERGERLLQKFAQLLQHAKQTQAQMKT